MLETLRGLLKLSFYNTRASTFVPSDPDVRVEVRAPKVPKQAQKESSVSRRVRTGLGATLPASHI